MTIRVRNLTDGEIEELELEADGLEAPASEILPADFPLPRLVKFVPDARKRVALEALTAAALAVNVAEPGGLAAADAALVSVRAQLEYVRADFEEPKRLAHQLHAHITERLREATAPAELALKTIGQRIFIENRRLEARALEARRLAQADADEIERKRAAAELETARAAGVSAPVLAMLETQAEGAKAAPLAVAETPALKGSALVSSWKARLVGTVDGAEINPAITDLSPAQLESVYALLEDIVRNRRNLAAVDLNWSAINARARAEKSVFAMAGLEAVEVGGTRAKGRRA